MVIDVSIDQEVPAAEGKSCAVASRPASGCPERGLRRTVRQVGLVVSDQVVVSGMRFFTTALIGRVCGPGELGVYSLGFTMLMLIAAIQESLILIPYNIFCGRVHSAGGTGYAGALLQQFFVLAGSMALVLAGLAHFLPRLGTLAALGPVVWVLAGLLPFELLREFGRRINVAHFRMGSALLLDSTVAAIQIGGLLALMFSGRLSAAGAYLVAGFSAAVPALTWLIASRKEFAFRTAHWTSAWLRNWSFGKWVFAAAMTSMVHMYAAYWLLAILSDAAAAGIFAACQTIVLLSNPFFLGMGNYLIRRAAHALDLGGISELRQIVVQATALNGVAMGAFSMLAALFGGWLLRLIYGPLYAGQQLTIGLLACASLASAMGMGPNHGLYALERPDVDLKANLLALAVMLVVTASLVGHFQLVGVATGLLAGNAAGTALRWAVYSRAIRETTTAAERCPSPVPERSEASGL
jgi:O-antigen/teichoic acid export membrane protein